MTLCKSGESVFMRKDHIKLQNKTSLNIQNKLCNILYFIISFKKMAKEIFIFWYWIFGRDFVVMDEIALR